MNDKDKQELLIAISGYLPYGLKLDILSRDNPNIHSIDQVRYDNVGIYERLIKNEDSKFDIKPYLRPLSSMTEEEKKYVEQLLDIIKASSSELDEMAKIIDNSHESIELIDFYNSHFLDYRGLIERGLAFPAPKDMY